MLSTDRVLDAVKQVKALRKLSATTHTITNRSQGKILRALSEEELTAVALLLAEEPIEGNNA